MYVQCSIMYGSAVVVSRWCAVHLWEEHAPYCCAWSSCDSTFAVLIKETDRQ